MQKNVLHFTVMQFTNSSFEGNQLKQVCLHKLYHIKYD